MADRMRTRRSFNFCIFSYSTMKISIHAEIWICWTCSHYSSFFHSILRQVDWSPYYGCSHVNPRIEYRLTVCMPACRKTRLKGNRMQSKIVGSRGCALTQANMVRAVTLSYDRPSNDPCRFQTPESIKTKHGTINNVANKSECATDNDNWPISDVPTHTWSVSFNKFYSCFPCLADSRTGWTAHRRSTYDGSNSSVSLKDMAFGISLMTNGKGLKTRQTPKNLRLKVKVQPTGTFL
jgi:hypothetical protein